jgi:hypothetical protein
VNNARSVQVDDARLNGVLRRARETRSALDERRN